MKSLSRVLLLGALAGAGLGLALCLTLPPDSHWGLLIPGGRGSRRATSAAAGPALLPASAAVATQPKDVATQLASPRQPRNVLRRVATGTTRRPATLSSPDAVNRQVPQRSVEPRPPETVQRSLAADLKPTTETTELRIRGEGTSGIALRRMERPVREIDHRPPEVTLEAMVLRVRLPDGREGVNFEFLQRHKNVRPAWPAPPHALNTPDASGDAPAMLRTRQPCLKFGLLDGPVPALLDTLELIGETKLLGVSRSTVRDDRPLTVTLAEAQAGKSSAPERATPPADLLQVWPRASATGSICLDIQVAPSADLTSEGAEHARDGKPSSRTTSRVVVRDGTTALLGGIRRQKTTVRSEKPPLPQDLSIPVQPSNADRGTVERYELLVVLRLHIVPNAVEQAGAGQRETLARHEEAKPEEEQPGPALRQALAARYYWAACSAYARSHAPAWERNAATLRIRQPQSPVPPAAIAGTASR